MRGIAAGPAGTGLQPGYRAVRMIEDEGQAAGADPVGLQRGGKIAGKFPDSIGDIFGPADRFRKSPPGVPRAGYG